jgi:hypothetical protein
MTFPFNDIPLELKNHPNWVLWKLEVRDGKPTKIPYTLAGERADSTNPDTWSGFPKAKWAFERGTNKVSGIGFVLSSDTRVIGIDWDHVKNSDTGEWDKEALEEIKLCGSYAEVSQSGTGAHVLVKGRIPSGGRRKDNIEMYSKDRFFVVTGQHIEGTPREIIENQEAIDKLYEKHFGEVPKKVKQQSEKKLSDSAIIDIASKAKNSDKFKRLFDGNTKGYDSPSNADLALCSLLAFYTQDEEQIDSIFRNSKLYRDKWDREDYKERTITIALAGVTETYNPESNNFEDRYSYKIIKDAHRIMEKEDPFTFMIDTWNLRHVGDKNLGQNCLCSVASTYILNSDMGLHVKPSGESGKGKSDAMLKILDLLPEHKYISGSFSGKALFYDPNLKSGTIIYSDDAHLNDDIIATIKQSTSDFQSPNMHRTVINGNFKTYPIPERCSFWFSSVDGIDDEQLANRFLNADVDGSKEQDLRVFNHIKNTEVLSYSLTDDDLETCRCIFDILEEERYTIKIPFMNAIDWRNIENRRNFLKFLDIIRAVTLYKIKQRNKVNGYYLAEIEDFYRAVEIYTGTAKNNATNLTNLEMKVLQFIASKNSYDDKGKLNWEEPVTIQDLMKEFKVSRERVHQILHGKDGKSGMLAKVAQLNKIDRSITIGEEGEDRVTTRRNEYSFTGNKMGLEIYDTVATIDETKAQEEMREFIKILFSEELHT